MDDFWSHKIIRAGCWLWTKGRSDGYGFFLPKIKGESKAHRISWTLTNGKIPKGLLVRHLCNRASCINPKHLALGTQYDNMQDRKLAGKYPIGERNHNSILKNKEVLEIRRMAKAGTPVIELSKIFGVCSSAIKRITERTTWKHLR